ncbi:MAG: GmrSD restriction endonuclease domain-containing protein [Candidatus Limnocylindrales bacterium]
MNGNTTVFKQVSYTLENLLAYIEQGDIGLPDIQRPFVWPATKVRDLFDSMFRGFPVGYLLFWENANGGAKTIGTDAKGHAPNRLIVDGQQRLTSLYAVLKGKPIVDSEYRQVKLEIAFRPRDGVFQVADAAIRRDPEYIASISEVWRNGNAFKTIGGFVDRLRARRDVPPEEEDAIAASLGRLFELKNYPFTALEVAASVDEDQVADIFVRINSAGAKLRQSDFILTLMSVFWDEGRKELETFARRSRTPSTDGSPSPYNPLWHPDPDQLLRTSVAVGFRRARLEHVYSILRGKDLETGQYSDVRREQQFAVLAGAQLRTLDLTAWHEFWKAVKAAGIRDRGGISSETALAYTYALFLIGHDLGLDWWRARALAARWLFMSALTGRYSGSSETVMDQDLAAFRDVTNGDAFVGHLEEQIAARLTEDYWAITLPNELQTAGTRSPYLLAYQAALVIGNAPSFLSKQSVAELVSPDVVGKRAPLERHHLFPKAYLERLGVSNAVDVNQVANLAIVAWDLNGRIADQGPHMYWPDLLDEFRRSGATEVDIASQYRWQALPAGWETLPYRDFLAERRRLMATVIRSVFEGLPHA